MAYFNTIMTEKQSITLFHFTHLSQEQLEEIYTYFEENQFNNNTTWGFKETYKEQGYIKSILVKKTTSLIPIFDFNIGSIVKKEIDFFTECFFAIDLKNELLEFYGNQKDFPKLKKALKPIINHNNRFETVDTSPFSLVPKLNNQQQINFEIKNLTINNYSAEEGVVGKYDLKVSQNPSGLSLIQRYKYDVIKCTLILYLDSEIIISFSRFGRLSIECSDSAFNYTLSYIKELILKQE